MSTADGPLLQHLPAIYSTWDDWYHREEGEEPALRPLLAAFEEVLFGREDKAGLVEEGAAHIQRELEMLFGCEDQRGLEQKIARLDGLFNPEQTPRKFLPWLAQWVALSQYQNLPEAQLRKLIANIVPLYSYRGTKKYLEQLLDYFIPENTEVVINDQELPGLTLGTSKVGLDSWLGVDRPFWFVVTLRAQVDTSDPAELANVKQKLEDSVRPVIELAKPAHTAYQLLVELEELFADYD